MKNPKKIGVFDSGIGGLTLAAEIKRQLPLESIIYFGDTAHFPYGDKSTAAIQAYSVKICDLLLNQGCKVILIACNSASASAFDLVKEYVGSRAKVFNVIDSVVNYVSENHSGESVGLIGTKRTVDSNVYKVKVDQQKKQVELKSLATPLLAPMIEEGFFKKEISSGIIAEYLSDSDLKNIKALILGCTHYPLIKEAIKEFYQQRVEVIDSPEIVIKEVKHFLEEHKLMSDGSKLMHEFYVSDYTDGFKTSTSIFFGEEVKLQKYKLWE